MNYNLEKKNIFSFIKHVYYHTFCLAMNRSNLIHFLLVTLFIRLREIYNHNFLFLPHRHFAYKIVTMLGNVIRARGSNHTE